MLSRIQSLGSCLIGLMLLLFAGSAAAEDVSFSCAAAIDRAAGSYSRCLLGAQSRNARRPGASRLEIAEQRCVDRFDAATARALARAERRQETCTPYLSEIAERTVTYAEGVATEAHGIPAVSVLFVQNGTGGTLSETTLTLTGVNPQTDWFTNRPYRVTGQVTTEDFIEQWDEGEGAFAGDPPNANFACEVGGEAVDYVVELTSPGMAGGDLSYSVEAVGDTVLPTALQCDATPQLFIDSSGCPLFEVCGPQRSEAWEIAHGCELATGKGLGCGCAGFEECNKPCGNFGILKCVSICSGHNWDTVFDSSASCKKAWNL